MKKSLGRIADWLKGEERGVRSKSRYEASDEFLIEFVTPTRKTPSVGYGKDVSTSGIRFGTFVKLKTGETLSGMVYFPKDFPGNKSINFESTVMRIYRPLHTRQYRAGCAFSNLSAQQKETLHQFIYWLETKN